MTSKYFIDNSDLSNIINLNPSSNANVNYIFLGVDLSNNALDSTLCESHRLHFLLL